MICDDVMIVLIEPNLKMVAGGSKIDYHPSPNVKMILVLIINTKGPYILVQSNISIFFRDRFGLIVIV